MVAALLVLAGFVCATLPDRFVDLALLSPGTASALIPPAGPGFDARAGRAAGVVIGHWLVERIAPDTYALGEPAAAPDNYEYLLIGRQRALLIDAGMTGRPITGVLARLTAKPVTVIPTHLHYDHVNGINNFRSVALIDLPETRRLAQGDIVTPGRYRYEGSSTFRFRVTEWVQPGTMIDLGGRQVTLLATPGHTMSSAAMLDSATQAMFTGDFIYPTSQYLFMSDSSLSTYRATADHLLAALPAATRLYGAHCCRNDAPPRAPWLDMSDLREVRDTVVTIEAGTAKGHGWPLARYPVNARMTLLTFYPLANR